MCVWGVIDETAATDRDVQMIPHEALQRSHLTSPSVGLGIVVEVGSAQTPPADILRYRVGGSATLQRCAIAFQLVAGTKKGSSVA